MSENKTNINWYPGHMAKTKKQIMQDLSFVDLVIELLDARIPVSSQNPDIGELTNKKKKILVLNKADLADEKENQKWVSYFESLKIPAVLVDSNSGTGIQTFMKKLDNLMEEELIKNAQKGRVGRKSRVMVIGIPNVGKSSFINRISKRATAQVGNKPGVTKSKQWIRINEKTELLDTPGVLWPKFQDEETALHLAFTGTIKDTILESTEVAYSLIKYLLEHEREKLCNRYNLKNEEVEEILNRPQPDNVNIYDVLLEIGKKRGAFLSGGRIDEEKTSKILLDEFKNGKLGKITIEKVGNLIK